jgi:hypothetical protein
MCVCVCIYISVSVCVCVYNTIFTPVYRNLAADRASKTEWEIKMVQFFYFCSFSFETGRFFQNLFFRMGDDDAGP